MQQSDLLSVDTVIANVQDKGNQILITDNNKDYYSFFKNKQDGLVTSAYQTFQTFATGSPVTIVFRLVPFKGKNLRSVVKFRAVDATRPSPPRQPLPKVTQELTPLSKEDVEINWFKLNHIASWAAIMSKIKAAFALAHPVEDINVEDIPF